METLQIEVPIRVTMDQEKKVLYFNDLVRALCLHPSAHHGVRDRIDPSQHWLMKEGHTKVRVVTVEGVSGLAVRLNKGGETIERILDLLSETKNDRDAGFIDLNERFDGASLIHQEMFKGAALDIYAGGSAKVPTATREQIGMALRYKNPADSIAKIHNRNKDIFIGHSWVVNLSTPQGVQKTWIYDLRGIMEICDLSHRPRAKEFRRHCHDVFDKIITNKLTRIDPVGLVEYSAEYNYKVGQRAKQYKNDKLHADEVHKVQTKRYENLIKQYKTEADVYRNKLVEARIETERCKKLIKEYKTEADGYRDQLVEARIKNTNNKPDTDKSDPHLEEMISNLKGIEDRKQN